MTQTQPQHQPQAQPEPQVVGDGPAPGAVEYPTPPTYQQIEAFGYQRFTNREQSRLDFGARLLDLAEDDGVPPNCSMSSTKYGSPRSRIRWRRACGPARSTACAPGSS